MHHHGYDVIVAGTSCCHLAAAAAGARLDRVGGAVPKLIGYT
jgi:hypothetical protein